MRILPQVKGLGRGMETRLELKTHLQTVLPFAACAFPFPLRFPRQDTWFVPILQLAGGGQEAQVLSYSSDNPQGSFLLPALLDFEEIPVSPVMTGNSSLPLA